MEQVKKVPKTTTLNVSIPVKAMLDEIKIEFLKLSGRSITYSAIIESLIMLSKANKGYEISIPSDTPSITKEKGDVAK